MGRDDGVARAGGAERPAHHGRVCGERAAPGFDGFLAEWAKVISFEDLERATVHILDCSLGHRWLLWSILFDHDLRARSDVADTLVGNIAAKSFLVCNDHFATIHPD